MFKFLRIIIQYLFVLFSLISIVFFIKTLIPGTPADIVLGDDASQDQKNLWLKENGLLEPIWKQYQNYLKSLLKGQLGKSFVHHKSVWCLTKEGLVASLSLASLACLMIFILSLCWGFVGFFQQTETRETIWTLFNSLLMAMPSMVLGPIFLYFFGVKLKLFNVLNAETGLKELFLPALSLALPLSAFNGQILCDQLQEISKSDFVLFARSLSLPKEVIFLKFIFKNAIVSLISIFTLQVGALLSGTVTIEKIFGLPGLGRVILRAVQERDHPVISGSVILIGFIYTSLNLMSDLFYAWFDPRVTKK
jgi:peptide/nickel transport system permease protein